MSALGVLGGTFDPVHRGHLALAAGAAAALRLERVALLPCSVPPHKPNLPISAAYHRLEMLYLAAEGWEGLRVLPFEIERGGVHYTIDTLRALRELGEEPVFLIGSDALAEIETWRRYAELLAEFDFAAVMRSRDPVSPAAPPFPDDVARRLTDVDALDPRAPLGRGGRIVRVPLDPPAVSSSQVRERAAAGDPIDALVPARVARYIQRHRLYR
jgi:nicotinate-nucleotide adenylyltransferase